MAISASNSTDKQSPYGYNTYYTLSVSFTENSYSVANNTSNITATARLSSSKYDAFDSGYNNVLSIHWYDNKSGKLVQKDYVNVSSLGTNDSVSVSETFNVTHKDDGSLSGYAKAVWEKNDGNGYTPDDFSVSTSSTALTKIPRASSPSMSANSYNINSQIKVNTNRKVSSFTHTISLTVGGITRQIGSAKGVGADATYTLSASDIATIMATIPNKTSITATITCTTYTGSNGSQVGSSASTTFTYNIPEATYKPSITNFTLAETGITNIGLGANDVVKKLSAKNILVEASTVNSATIQSVKVVNADVSTALTLVNNQYTGTMANLSSGTFVATVTDSRGFTDTQTITGIFYNNPGIVITGVTCARPTDTASTADLSAEVIYLSGTVGNVTNTLTCSYTLNNDPQPVAVGTSSANSPVTFTKSNISGMDYRENFTFTITATDSLGQSAQWVATLSGSVPTFWLGKDTARCSNHWIFENIGMYDSDDVLQEIDGAHFKSLVNVDDTVDAILEHNGNKNLITMMTPTKTENGVTFTNNGTYYNVNGTATANAFCNASTDVPMEVGKKYILSGLHDAWVQGLQVVVRYVSDPTIIAIAEEDDVEFTAPAPCYAYLVVKSGTTVSNIKWYPMIRDARIASETYVPGSMGCQNLRWSGTWSNSSSITRNYRIFGKGLVFAQVVVLSDTTNDTGTVGTYIDLRTSSSFVSTLGANANRMNTANTASIRSSSTGVYYYDGSSSNDRLRLYASCTKNGTNTWYINITTIGCTIQQV